MNKSLLYFLIGTSLFCGTFYSYVAAAQSISPEKKADIYELMRLDGQTDHAKEMYKEIFKTFQSSNPSVPPSAWDDIKSTTNTELLLEDLATVYDKYLSDDDIKNLILFRRSSIGQRYSTVQNKMNQDTAKVCSIWGQKMAVIIQEKLWDKNIDFDAYDNLEDYDSCDND